MSHSYIGCVLQFWASLRYRHRHLFIVPSGCKIGPLNDIQSFLPGALVVMYELSVAAARNDISTSSRIGGDVTNSAAVQFVSSVCTVLYTIPYEPIPMSTTSPWNVTNVQPSRNVQLSNVRYAHICYILFTYQKFVKSDFNASTISDVSATSLEELLIEVLNQYWETNITRLIRPIAILTKIKPFYRYGFRASNQEQCEYVSIQLYPVSRLYGCITHWLCPTGGTSVNIGMTVIVRLVLETDSTAGSVFALDACHPQPRQVYLVHSYF